MDFRVFPYMFMPFLFGLVYIVVIVYGFVLLYRIANGVQSIARSVEDLARRPQVAPLSTSSAPHDVGR